MIQPVWLLPSVPAAMYLILFLMERISPLRAAVRPLWPRVWVNVVVSALVFTVAAVTVGPAVSRLLGLSPERTQGLPPGVTGA